MCLTSCPESIGASPVLQIDFNLVGMGWLKLQRAVFRPPAEPHHTPQQQQAAARQQPAACPASSNSTCWDPWKADSAANVAYGTPAQPQQQGSGQQGSAGVPCGTAGASSLSSQGLAGSECVWDQETIPRGWQWSVFAEEVGCPAG